MRYAPQGFSRHNGSPLPVVSWSFILKLHIFQSSVENDQFQGTSFVTDIKINFSMGDFLYFIEFVTCAIKKEKKRKSEHQQLEQKTDRTMSQLILNLN